MFPWPHSFYAISYICQDASIIFYKRYLQKEKAVISLYGNVNGSRRVLYIGNLNSPFQREMYKFIKLYGKSYGLIVDNYDLKSGRSLKEKLKFRLSLANLFFKVNVNFDCIFVEFLGDNAYFTSLLNFKKKPIIVRCHRTELYEYWNKYRERVIKAASRASLIICVSNAIRRRLINLIPWIKDESTVIFNSVDPYRFKPKDVLRDKEELIVGSLGRLIPLKGFEELIIAVGSLIKQGLKIKLKIGGEGPLSSRLERIIDKLNLKNKVYLEGHIPYEHVNKWYHSIDLFVLNSRIEGMSTVILEAMASGLPVVATNIGVYLKWLIGDGHIILVILKGLKS